MIADKVIPSFYLLELEGDAVQSLVQGDFGIERVVIGSFDFPSDMLAVEAMRKSMTDIVDVMGDSRIKEEAFFNPEFFPSIKTEYSEEAVSELEEAQAIADAMTEDLVEKGQVPIFMTNVFDVLGDFVQSRWVVTSNSFKMTGKIAANPSKYMMHKGFEQVKRHETVHRDELNHIRIH